MPYRKADCTSFLLLLVSLRLRIRAYSSPTTLSPNMDTAVRAKEDSDAPTHITPKEEDNHPVSSRSPEKLPIRGDTPNPTTTQQRRDGDSMDWESWPTGQSGPLVSEAAMQRATNLFHSLDSARNVWSRTEETVFHVTEFSLTGRSEFGVCHNLV